MDNMSAWLPGHQDVFFNLYCIRLQADYRHQVEHVLQANQDDHYRYQRLMDAFQTLVTANGVTLSVSSRNTIRFKSNLRQLLLHVRGFLCIK